MMQQYRSNSYLFGGNAPYVEEMYEAYLDNPGSVPDNWRAYFDALQHVPATDGSNARDVAHAPVIESFAQRAKANAFAVKASASELAVSRKQVHVQSLIAAYRSLGARWADLDPLQRQERPKIPELEPAFYDLSESDMDITFSATNTYFTTAEQQTLREILQALRETYCGTIGAEFMHITEPVEKRWWQQKLEAIRSKPNFSAEQKKHILDRLTAAEGLERYLHTKYVGQKRFSLEGGESFIASMDAVVQGAGARGVQEIVIGMAHRGRLNVLVNTLGKMPKDLFAEFDHTAKEELPAGDVKYHQGFSSDVTTPGGPVHLSLAFNPSHLEIVNPVVEGSVRARQERRGDARGERVLPILIHGDAAFAGQGVVMETLQLSQVRGYATGGTVHIVVNNQVGFTTSNPDDARSTMYCSDVAKMLEAPIFHVNADDPEAVIFVTRLALAYRMRFRQDVVIDLVCYRRHGHNEADEPAATQPVMYQAIRKHPTARRIYADRLVAEGVLSEAEAAGLVEQYRTGLDEGRPQARASLGMIGNKFTVDWSKYAHVDWQERVPPVGVERLRTLGARITEVPAGFTLHPRVALVMANRVKMLAGELPFDWGCAETLAYATLLDAGYPVRISGQDVGRGTFFHRHAALHEQRTAAVYIPLQHVSDEQPRFQVIDSVLSEEAVMGFEYGYSTTEPHALVIWEAQFGDFMNGAQVVIDQFISSGEAKWGRLCGLALFLPHGYEGQGPEHSSARLERFLQLCAENNMQVCVPSTPAQMYHMIRRQMLRSFRKPLIVMTPKSLLRHDLSVSTIDELAQGRFANVLDEIDDLPAAGVRRVVFCSGKVYFDLLKARRKDSIRDVALVRIEQLYPFPADEYEAVLRRYPAARDVVWCQEEPQNQGAWYQIRHRLQERLPAKVELLYAGRPHAAAPATGILKVHELEQAALIEAALRSQSTEDAGRETTRLTATGVRKKS